MGLLGRKTKTLNKEAEISLLGTAISLGTLVFCGSCLPEPWINPIPELSKFLMSGQITDNRLGSSAITPSSYSCRLDFFYFSQQRKTHISLTCIRANPFSIGKFIIFFISVCLASAFCSSTITATNAFVFYNFFFLANIAVEQIPAGKICLMFSAGL